MSHVRVSVLLCTMVLMFFCAAGVPAQKESRVKRSLPYWNLWSSDFYGWVEELRSQSGYDTLIDLARTYWAHFPIASFLGYDSTPGQEDLPEQEVEN
ncbi:otospiralin-like [Xyrauchen texanus]|uniref:otospiralin-like n=1 Tax=Xyrauchen texanus TaxID=154827 RepID=UPI002242A6CD|nr:otospiralin-like [Xyrauchen texanus]